MASGKGMIRYPEFQQIEEIFETRDMMTGEIVNYIDFENMSERIKYIKTQDKAQKLSEEDFGLLVEKGSWELLDLIVNGKDQGEVLSFLSDQISKIFELEMCFENRRTFLIYASLRGDVDIVSKIIQMKPCLLNAVDELGKAPIHYSIQFNKFKVFKALVEAGCDVNLQDARGHTPLHLAAIHSRRDYYLFLKFRQADSAIEDSTQMKAIDYITNREDYINFVQMEFNVSKKELPQFFNENVCIANHDFILQKNHRFLNRKLQLMEKVGISTQAGSKPIPNCYEDLYSEVLAAKYQQEHEPKPQNDLELEDNKSSGIDSDLDMQPISAASFEIRDKIGHGSFGEIYAVSLKGSDKVYAMKSYYKRHMLSNNMIRFLFVEKKIMMNFTHPFICQLHYTFQTGKKLYMVMDFCQRKDLGKYLKDVGLLSEHQAKILICELILALDALHSNNTIHRDIKPDNILIEADGHIKLADFGLAKEKIKHSELSYTFCGSIAYLPPEVILKTGHNKSLDWYLLGEILYEVLVGRPPFFDSNKERLHENIIKKDVYYPSHLSKNVTSLIQGLLDRDIDKRLGSKYGGRELMEHPFFVGIDWHKVFSKGYTLFVPKDVPSYELKCKNEQIPDTLPDGKHHVELPYWSFARFD